MLLQLASGEHAEVKDQQIAETSNATLDRAVTVRYSGERREEEQAVFVPESCDWPAGRHCATTVSRSYLDDVQPGVILAPENAKKKETSMKKVIIKKGIEKLPAEYMPQKKTSSGDTLKVGSYKGPREETK
jgi:protein LTV1